MVFEKPAARGRDPGNSRVETSEQIKKKGVLEYHDMIACNIVVRRNLDDE